MSGSKKWLEVIPASKERDKTLGMRETIFKTASTIEFRKHRAPERNHNFRTLLVIPELTKKLCSYKRHADGTAQELRPRN